MFKCSLLHPVPQEGGSIKAYSMEILPDPISVPPICFNVVQVLMFTRAHHKLKENVCKLKLHYHKWFFLQWNYSRFVIVLCFFWSGHLFHCQPEPCFPPSVCLWSASFPVWYLWTLRSGACLLEFLWAFAS